MPDFGEQLVAEAREWIGTPFHWGAAVKGAGCDCRGLISGAARVLGRAEAQTFEAVWIGYGQRADPDKLRAGMDRLFDAVAGQPVPGDLMLLNIAGKPQHLAIYAGGGRMIHTYGQGPACVLEVPMGNVWRAAIAGIYRWKSHDVD